MSATPTDPRNRKAQDATLVNVDHLKKLVEELTTRVSDLEHQLVSLSTKLDRLF